MATTIGTLMGQYGEIDLQGHGEDVTFYADGTTPASVKALIVRGTLEPGPGGLPVYGIEVLIRKIDAPTVYVGKSRVSLKQRETDAAAKSFVVKELRDSDGGFWRMGIQ